MRPSQCAAHTDPLILTSAVGPACRSVPVPVNSFLEDPEVVEALRFFEKALLQIFQFYATDGGRKRRARTKGPRAGGEGRNTMTDALGYQEFLRFAKDFNLSSSVILSTLELGDIFLSCVEVRPGAASRSPSRLS